VANKDKILATAQKCLQKNNLTRAIKEYLKVVEIDSRDVRSRQKLAELYSRTQKVEEALSHYEVVANYYADNTFYLKAIAVYKQMQRLVPEKLDYTFKLAQLNEQQGLVGNALSEYRTLLKAYEKTEENEEAIKVLDRMRELDPENVTIGMRIAEFYARIGDEDQAHEAFSVVEQKLKQLGNYKQLQNFYEHFIGVWPDDVSIQIGHGLAMVDYGEPLGGVQFLTKLQRQHPKNECVLFALSRGFHQCSQFDHEIECLERLIDWNPSNLDYHLAIYSSALELDDAVKTLKYLELGKEFFFAEKRVAEIKPFYEQVRDLLPDNRELLSSLHAVYEELGEGEKLFDVLSSDLGAGQLSEDGLEVESFNAQDGNSADSSEISFEELEFDTVEESADDSSDEVSFDEITFDIADESGSSDSLFDLDTSEVDTPHVDIQADLEEADFYLQQGLLEEAQHVFKRLELSHPDHSGVLNLKEQLGQRQESLNKRDVPDVDFGNMSKPTEVSIDLDLDLDGIDLSIEESSPVESFDFHDGSADIEHSFDGLQINPQVGLEPEPELADSQRGVVTVITDDDTESSYNLGIAYKEMGLFDDAIAEFDKAVNSPARKLDCISLKAACFVDQQKYDEAESVLTAGLSDPSVSIKDQVLLYYETGLLYEAWHRYADALSSYQVVADNDPQFRNVTVKIGELKDLVDDDSVSETNRVSYL